jgi:hypothetical protein
VLGKEGVYTSGTEALSKVAVPTTETLRVFMTAGEAQEWVENTSRRVRHSTRVSPDTKSGLYRDKHSRQDLRCGSHEMGSMGNPGLSGYHLQGTGLNQGEATVGTDPSTG